jgi:hypothetical protein
MKPAACKTDTTCLQVFSTGPHLNPLISPPCGEEPGEADRIARVDVTHAPVSVER